MVSGVGIYARVSSDPGETRLGVGRQVADCRALAEGLGWPVADVYVDNDVSAWSGRARPEYRRLLDDLKDGVVDGVVVWQLDRLHRSPAELEEFFSVLDAAGVAENLATYTGEYDLSMPEGRLTARILGAVARKESDDRSLRIRRKHEELAASGKPSGGGTRPFGYEPDRVTVRPAEAAVVREAAERVLAGESLRSVCADLNERGVTTSAGGRWSITTLRRVLTSARISGRRGHKDDIVGDAVWEAIIAPGVSDRLRERLGAGSSRRAARTRRRCLLTGGLLRCGICGTVMVSQPRAGGIARYRCRSQDGGCGRMSASAAPLDAFVVEAVLQRLDTPELAAALAETRQRDQEIDDLHQQIVEDKAMLEDLAAQWADKAITRPEWVAARQPIQQRIDSNHRRLARISPMTPIDDYAGNAAALRTVWDGLDITRKHAIVAAVLDHIAVHPATGGGGFDPGRFAPLWRL
jgi:site-specific DNA recombinase